MKLRLPVALGALVLVLSVSTLAACQDGSSSESTDPATRRNLVGSWRSTGSSDETTRYFFGGRHLAGTDGPRRRLRNGALLALDRAVGALERPGQLHHLRRCLPKARRPGRVGGRAGSTQSKSFKSRRVGSRRAGTAISGTSSARTRDGTPPAGPSPITARQYNKHPQAQPDRKETSMKTRSYRSCPQCHKRMTTFTKDADGERVFYRCSDCGTIGTFYPARNFWSQNWPKDVVKQAIERGVLPKG